MIFSII